MKPNRFSIDAASSVARPGCRGMRAAPVARSDNYDATALYLEPHASSDDHAVPYDHWLAVTGGSGSVSIGDESQPVRAGDSVLLPAGMFHRMWTEQNEMVALALAFRLAPGPELVRVPDRLALARNAAERFVLIARRSIEERGRFTVALSGGSTPRELYALLAAPDFASQVDWTRVHVFWGDERAVPPDSPESNYRTAREQLGHLPIPADQVHRIMGEEEPGQAALDYEQTLREMLTPALVPPPSNAEGAGEGIPCLDLVLLGLGANGHTASLFPHGAALRETRRWVVAEYVPEVGMHRITLTPSILSAAENILFLVAGADKALTVQAVLRGPYRPDELPAQLIQPEQGHLVWLLDREAASAL